MITITEVEVTKWRDPNMVIGRVYLHEENGQNVIIRAFEVPIEDLGYTNSNSFFIASAGLDITDDAEEALRTWIESYFFLDRQPKTIAIESKGSVEMQLFASLVKERSNDSVLNDFAKKLVQ